MKVEETVYFNLSDGRTIFVKNLDEELRNQVLVLDRLRQDVVDKSYEMQVYSTALEVHKQNIQKGLEKFIKSESKDSKETNTDTES